MEQLDAYSNEEGVGEQYIRPLEYIFRGEWGKHRRRLTGAFRNTPSTPSLALFPDFNEAIDEFYREVGYRLTEVEKNNFIAFAQHYGLTTNLLDVTPSPLTALFMACHRDWYSLRGEYQQEKDTLAYVYIFDDYIDITDIMSKYPDKSILELLINMDEYTINKFMQLLDKRDRQFLYAGGSKVMELVKAICVDIFRVTVSAYSPEFEAINTKLMAAINLEHKSLNSLYGLLNYHNGLYDLADNLLASKQMEKFPVQKSDIAPKELMRCYMVFLVFYLRMIRGNAKTYDAGKFMPHMIYKPKVTFERARLQQGFFIVQPFLKPLGDENDSRIRFVQEIRHSKAIEVGNPEKILRQLNSIGINLGNMYGDFDSIAKYIKKKC